MQFLLLNIGEKIMSKESWGWNSSLDKEYETYKNSGLEAGRIIKESRHIYTVASGEELIRAEVSGAFQYRAVRRSDYPVIGDWVLYRPAPPDKGLIEAVMQRKSQFSRKVAGEKTEEQILVSNIDVIYLVFGINGGRNFTRGGLERYI